MCSRYISYCSVLYSYRIPYCCILVPRNKTYCSILRTNCIYFLLRFLALDNAIACACFNVLPSFINNRIFEEITFWDLPFLSGIIFYVYNLFKSSKVLSLPSFLINFLIAAWPDPSFFAILLKNLTFCSLPKVFTCSFLSCFNNQSP